MWHDHVLFTGDLVRGFIDFGGVKIDHVSVDLARLLGSMVGDDRAVFDLGLESYARIRPLSDEQRALARLLDITGVLIGIENWLRWLYAERKSLDDADAASKRLQALVERVEKWVPLA
jgi:Ser/Thr protein kinase RdoA (MazF antagonist)